MKTFKTKLLLDKEQRTYFNKAFGIRRWTWNWAVEEYFKAAKNDVFPSAFDLQKQINNTLAKQPEFSWLTEVNSMVRGEALKDFGLSIKAWHRNQYLSRRTSENFEADKGKPHFQKKGKSVDSCRYFNKANPVKYVSPHFVSMTRTMGFKPFRLQTAEKVTCLKDIKVCLTTVSREHGQYYIAFTFERTNQKARRKGVSCVGIDLGVKHTAVIYDGRESKFFDLPTTLLKSEQYVALCNQRLARTEKDSKNHFKRVVQLQRAYAHVANIRKDFLAKLTTFLVSNYETIKVDDFSFKNYLKETETSYAKHKAVKKVYEVAPFMLEAMLEYKCAERGNVLLYVPKGTPTTKTCSSCGEKHEVSLDERTFVCPHCGASLDRDLNSAINVFNLKI